MSSFTSASESGNFTISPNPNSNQLFFDNNYWYLVLLNENNSSPMNSSITFNNIPTNGLNYLLIGGGGGGGNSGNGSGGDNLYASSGGGGGGGGDVVTGNFSPISSNQYSIVVGYGGSAQNDGYWTTFNNNQIKAYGGNQGGDGADGSVSNNMGGSNAGSGGGGGGAARINNNGGGNGMAQAVTKDSNTSNNVPGSKFSIGSQSDQVYIDNNKLIIDGKTQPTYYVAFGGGGGASGNISSGQGNGTGETIFGSGGNGVAGYGVGGGDSTNGFPGVGPGVGGGGGGGTFGGGGGGGSASQGGTGGPGIAIFWWEDEYACLCGLTPQSTIEKQLGTNFNNAQETCQQAIEYAAQNSYLSQYSNNLISLIDISQNWASVNDMWNSDSNKNAFDINCSGVTVTPAYNVIDANLSKIQSQCAGWISQYETTYSSLIQDALQPSIPEISPDSGTTKLIDQQIALFYETQLDYLNGLEQRLKKILNYLNGLNIPFDISGSSGNATIGSKTVLNLTPENVYFTSPQNASSESTGKIMINGIPGNQNLSFFLPNGADGTIGPMGPKGLTGLKGKPGKMGGQGSKGIGETPYQYYKTF